MMTKYRVTRVWEVDAIDANDAIQKTKNWKHTNVISQKLEPILYYPEYDFRDTSSIPNPTYECKEPWKKEEVFKIISKHPFRIIMNPNLPKYVPPYDNQSPYCHYMDDD